MSTGQIIQLPDSKLRRWREIEPEFQAGLLSHGYADDEITVSLWRLRAVFMKYEMSIRVAIDPDDIAKSVVEIENRLNPLVAGLMYEIIVREIELFRLRGEVG